MQYPDAVSIAPVLVNMKTAASALAISRGKLYQLIDAGEIRRVKIGARALIPVSELTEFAARLAAASEPTDGPSRAA